MRYFVSLILVALPLLGSAQAVCTSALSGDAPEETAQFAFLVGDHEVTLHAWTGEGWTPPRPVNARWRGWYGLDGRGIYDEWQDPQAPNGGVGINVRVYDTKEQVWKMMWISTSGMQVQDLRAEVRDGKLTMWQVYPPRPGWQAVFEVLDDKSWAREEFVQDDSGEWTPRFRLVAHRERCPPF